MMSEDDDGAVSCGQCVIVDISDLVIAERVHKEAASNTN